MRRIFGGLTENPYFCKKLKIHRKQASLFPGLTYINKLGGVKCENLLIFAKWISAAMTHIEPGK